MDSEHFLKDIYSILSEDNIADLLQIIEEKKKELNITSERQLSVLTGIDRKTLDRIADGEAKSVDLISLLKLNEFLGLGIESIVQSYVSNMKSEYFREVEDVRKANFIVRNFDIKTLKKIGFIDKTTDFKAIENRIVGFFGLNSLFEYQTEVGHTLFSRTRAKSHDKMRDFWVRCAHFQFQKINNPNEFSREQLEELIPRIRPYTRFEQNGFLSVVRALHHIGITVIVQSYLSNTQVKGATFIVDKKPCIVITDYRGFYDTIWFTLMHEIYHALEDYDKLLTMKYHLSGEDNLFLLDEEDADYFAREMLFPQEKRDYIKPYLNISQQVQQYAIQNKVHPSIIYGFHCYDSGEWQKYQRFIPKSDVALRALKTYPWNNEDIFEGVEKVKLVYTNQ